MILSQKNLNISESLTLAIDAKAKKMLSEGYDVIGFGAGEPDFPTPDYIIQAAKNALDQGLTRYTPSSGILQLRKAICRKLERDNHIVYTPDEIIVSNGAKHSLYNIFQAILNPGDQVLIPKPYWLSYPEMVKMADGIPVFIDTKEENCFKVTRDDIEKAINPNTKAIILNSPSNPNGCVYKKEELEVIAELAVKRGLFIVSDEIYEEMVYDETQHVSIASLNDKVKELTLTVNGMSKAYAMTGWRIGYVAGPLDVINVMSNIQSHSTSNPNSIAQYASIAALETPKEKIQEMVSVFDERRLYMVEKINSIPLLSCKLPKGSFYVMMNISQAIGKRHGNTLINGSISFADALLESKKVTIVPGIAFGADLFVRLSYATSMDKIQKGLDRIQQFMEELV
ncbi:MAG: pyridoxal phosphate-dependent aminotransferase [Caldicoprobacterales bacterium]|jgi:aspartate aminotransferase|nr:pyridoxal phosphate-dependent aminotransferase [Clostridiales bacterium]